MEKMVHRRLTWLFHHNDVLPVDMSGFQPERCSPDAIMCLTSLKEEARFHYDTAHVAFLDVHRAFAALLHESVINQLRRSGVCDRSHIYVGSVLHNRRMHVRVHGATSTVRLVTQGVPQESVLSPLFLMQLLLTSLDIFNNGCF